MQRRQVLRGSAVAAAVGLAGCGALGGSDPAAALSSRFVPPPRKTDGSVEIDVRVTNPGEDETTATVEGRAETDSRTYTATTEVTVSGGSKKTVTLVFEELDHTLDVAFTARVV